MSAERKARFKSIAIKLAAMGVAILAAGLVYRYATPRTYRAVAKVELLKSAWNNSTPGTGNFGPDKLPGECEAARSDLILNQTISNLDLIAAWGLHSSSGNSSSLDQARQRLRAMLEVEPAPSAMLIHVSAIGPDPVEVAKIVNEVGRLYSDLRRAGRERASQAGIDSLKAQWAEQEATVKAERLKLDQMAQNYNQDRATNIVALYDSSAWDTLRSSYAAAQEEYSRTSNELSTLRSLSRPDLIKALLTNDAGSNILLAGALQRLDQAGRDLRETQAAHGPDASETKSAALAVAGLSNQVDHLLAAGISGRSVELSALKASLDGMRAMADTAQKAANDDDRQRRTRAQDEAYGREKSNLEGLIADRDALENEIKLKGSMTAAMPNVITARMVDAADPPTEPYRPDFRLEIAAFAAGGTVAAAGLLLLGLLALRPRLA